MSNRSVVAAAVAARRLLFPVRAVKYFSTHGKFVPYMPITSSSSLVVRRSTQNSCAIICPSILKNHVQIRALSADASFPADLDRTKSTVDIPVGGENLYRRVGGPGYPMLFDVKYDKPSWQPLWEDEHKVIPRDGFGVPAHIPPEVSTTIKHVYHVPPQFYAFLKKLGDDTPALRPYMQKLVKGEFTFQDYEEMFYKFAKPLKIYRRQIPMPFRSAEEMAREAEVQWEGAWLSYRQRVLADYNSHMYLREYLYGALIGIFFGYVWLDSHRQYRIDMKLFYLEAPEHKINWVKPRGDLI